MTRPTPHSGFGVVHLGNPPAEPHDEVQHVLTITYVTTSTFPDFYVSAAEAREKRVKRLRESKVPYLEIDGGVEFVDRDGSTVRLTWTAPVTVTATGDPNQQGEQQ